MKKRWDLLLAAGFLLSLPLCVWAWLFDIRLILFLPALPAFCIQLLLCRKTRLPALRLLPAGLVILFALLGAGICFTASGWDGLLGFLMLCVSISPAVGCLAGWLTYGLPMLHRRHMRR